MRQHRDPTLFLCAAWFALALLPRANAAVAGSGPLFSPPAVFPVPGPTALATLDLDGDGDVDILVGSSDSLRVFLNSGDGQFVRAGGYGLFAGASDLAVGDFNKDGAPDIALTTSALSTSYVGVALNVGGGSLSFHSPAGYHSDRWLPGLPYEGSHHLAVGDLNNDGTLDVATTQGLLLGGGDGSLGTLLPVDSFCTVVDVALTDVDHDGTLDAVTAGCTGTQVIGTRHGNGDATFQQPRPYASLQAAVVHLSDVNADGLTDAIVGCDSSNGGVSLLLGRSDGTLAEHVDYATGTEVADALVGEYTGDGIPDVVIGSYEGGARVLPGLGNGALGAAITIYSSILCRKLATADFNADGSDDLAIASYDTLAILLNDVSTDARQEDPPRSHTVSRLRPILMRSGAIYVRGYAARAGVLTLTLCDASGRSVETLSGSVQEGENNALMHLPVPRRIPAGRYLARLSLPPETLIAVTLLLH